jgi:CubicO group peptidase (beta-lactamase class C family)
LTAFDKILAVSIILVSGIYCSNTNHDTKTGTQVKAPLLPPQMTFDSSFNPQRAAIIDNYFKKRNAMGHFSGAFLFYDSGKYYTNAYGFANGKLKTALKPEMPFQIASVSKTITAYTILSLIDKGKLNLTTGVYQILEGFPYKQITVAHLLSHKSGIPNYMYFAESYYKNKYRHLTNADVLLMLKRYRPKLEFTPNSRYKYSNTNYVLLALIVESLTGQNFQTYVQDSIFKVVGMNNSFIFTPEMSTLNQTVQGHVGGRSIIADFYQNGTMGDKGVYTSVYDLLVFDQALRKHILVTPTTLKEACTPHTPCRPTMDYYGYGWRIRYYNTGDTIIYHNGWWQGFKAYLVRWKNKDRCVIVLANTVSGGFIKQTDLMALMDGIKPSELTSIQAED